MDPVIFFFFFFHGLEIRLLIFPPDDKTFTVQFLFLGVDLCFTKEHPSVLLRVTQVPKQTSFFRRNWLKTSHLLR